MRIASIVTAATLSMILPAVPVFARESVTVFPKPIDAFSVHMQQQDQDVDVSYLENGTWTAWSDVELDDEQDPRSHESAIMMVPEGVTTLKLRTDKGTVTVHPITVSDAPMSYIVAARMDVSAGRIIRRAEWGADDSLLFTSKKPIETTAPSEAGDTGGSTGRERDCEQMLTDYPNEFKTKNRVTEVNGSYLRWPHEYSPQVKLLIVHHTAVANDNRSGVERMRALYQYHANNKGWGDIGYHFIVDDEGQIYEGKSGGASVVGGHAYCNNVGSIGIALMGNFETEKPTQTQMQSLQWLLHTLAEQYDIDPGTMVKFHGAMEQPILRHRDVVSTTCPGYYVAETIDQVRSHVVAGNLTAAIKFPVLVKANSTNNTAARRAAREATIGQTTSASAQFVGLQPQGSTTLSARPGEQMLLTIAYKAGSKSVAERKSVGKISRSDPGLQVWQDSNGTFKRLNTQLPLTDDVRPNETLLMRLKLQLPRADGSYTLNIGDVRYSIGISGQRVRGPSVNIPISYERPVSSPVVPVSSSSKSSVSSSVKVTSVARVPIRIRLSYGRDTLSVSDSATISADGAMTIGTTSVAKGSTVSLSKNGTACVATFNNKQLASGTVRMDPGTSILHIDSWNKSTNSFRGIMECRVIDGKITLINELSLEDYMIGIAEEPDTEPYEKQKAFAIAARTYAAFYLDPANRKFAGQPFDGSDSPAEFQMYGGYDFETKHKEWVRAVRETTGQVLKKDGQVIKAPYFSADDGRTRAPSEAGWNNFPFAEVFASKPDPWCNGMTLRGHGVGMSGCGAKAQALEGKTSTQILKYYYPGTTIEAVK